jgi:transposase InsO family protein
VLKVLKINKSSYYEYINRKESKRSQFHKKIDQEIMQIHEEYYQTYGYPRMKVELNRRGFKVSEQLVYRRMKALKISAIQKTKSYRGTNKGNNDNLPNLLNRDFKTTGINKAWVTDITTYIYTINNGWCYLSSIIDLYTRKVIAYVVDKSMTVDLVKKTLKKAVLAYKPKEGIILHSDRGSQYTSNDFKEYCEELKIKQSFSKKGDPYDNIIIEAFHSTIKNEFIYRIKRLNNLEELKIAIFKYITFYNRKRLHSSLSYHTPDEWERLHNKGTA